jgi:Spy/CpxP family protein refolding chaperone
MLTGTLWRGAQWSAHTGATFRIPKRNPMKAMRYVLMLVAALIVVPAFAQTTPAQTQPGAVPANNMQILREKLMADKKLLVAANLRLTEAEAKKFWPIYEAYQQELHKLNDQIAMLLVSYAKDYTANTLTNAKASALLDRYVAIEEADIKAKRVLIKKVRAVLPGLKVTQYVQIENKIRALVKYEIAGEVPLAQ